MEQRVLDFSGTSVDFDGNPYYEQIVEGNRLVNTDKELTLATILSNNLGNSTVGDIYKYSDWVKALRKDGILTVDAADAKALKKFVEDLKTDESKGRNGLSIWIKRQFFDVFDEADEVVKAKKKAKEQEKEITNGDGQTE